MPGPIARCDPVNLIATIVYAVAGVPGYLPYASASSNRGLYRGVYLVNLVAGHPF